DATPGTAPCPRQAAPRQSAQSPTPPTEGSLVDRGLATASVRAGAPAAVVVADRDGVVEDRADVLSREDIVSRAVRQRCAVSQQERVRDRGGDLLEVVGHEDRREVRVLVREDLE